MIKHNTIERPINTIIQIIDNGFLFLVHDDLLSNHIHDQGMGTLGKITTRFRHEFNPLFLMIWEKVLDSLLDLLRYVKERYTWTIHPTKPATNVHHRYRNIELFRNIDCFAYRFQRIIICILRRTIASYMETEPHNIQFQRLGNHEQLLNLLQTTSELFIEFAHTLTIIYRQT